MILIPWLLGKGILLVFYGKRADREFTAGDCFLTGWITEIGLAEAAHLTAVLFGRSFSDCVKLFGAGVLICALLSALLLTLHYGMLRRGKSGNNIAGKRTARGTGKKSEIKKRKITGREQAAIFLFLAMATIQLVTLAAVGSVYREGDMTLETVNSFLATDAVYQVNPLTGKAYETEMPFRLQVLCLPTLYGMTARISGLSPETTVRVIVPVVVLIASYLAYASVARALFQEDIFKRFCFLSLTALLVWVGDYRYGMEGFGLLHGGFRGVTLRGAVLLPYTVGLMLRKKYKSVLLCILAEACIVWTLYGFGMCFLAALGMFFSERILRADGRKGLAVAKEGRT